jgi:hypothetical protein
VLNAEAEKAVAKLNAAADMLVAMELKGLEGRAYEGEREALADQWEMKSIDLQTDARKKLGGRSCLHWALAFPEVSARGFDAFVGNPPFKAGAALGTLFGDDWRELIVRDIGRDIKTRRGQYDLCVFFFLQACRLVNGRGIVSGIATNSFPQGDSRLLGLVQMYSQGFRAFRAINDLPWPGTVATHVCLVWLASEDWKGEHWLDGIKVVAISDALAAQVSDNQATVRSKE